MPLKKLLFIFVFLVASVTHATEIKPLSPQPTEFKNPIFNYILYPISHSAVVAIRVTPSTIYTVPERRGFAEYKEARSEGYQVIKDEMDEIILIEFGKKPNGEKEIAYAVRMRIQNDCEITEEEVWHQPITGPLQFHGNISWRHSAAPGCKPHDYIYHGLPGSHGPALKHPSPEVPACTVHGPDYKPQPSIYNKPR